MNVVLPKGYVAASNYASSDTAGVQLGRFVRLTAAQTIDRVSASTQLPIGVVEENVDVGKVATGKAAVNVLVLGIARVVAGAAIASIGVEIMSDTTGRAVAAATTGNRVCGINLQTAGAAGDLIDVLLTPAGRLIP